MSEEYLPISNLNDFIFCPVSIYFHSLDYDSDKMLIKSEKQINGTSSHSACDEGRYTDKKSILQGISVISEEYGLIGKIDVFDSVSGMLTERKKKIKYMTDIFFNFMHSILHYARWDML